MDIVEVTPDDAIVERVAFLGSLDIAGRRIINGIGRTAGSWIGKNFFKATVVGGEVDVERAVAVSNVELTVRVV